MSQPQAGVVVLGMGRSGTSAVADMLVHAGFFAGDPEDLAPADPGNPKGYFEHLHVLQTNERVLHELGGWWYDPPPLPDQLQATEWTQPLLHAALERLTGQAGSRPVVLKDPRIGALFGLWEPILRDLMHPVLVIRDPVEIAKSLFSRDATPLAFGVAMWELHLTFLLSLLDGVLVTVAPYQQLLADPSLAERLTSVVAAHIEPSRAEAIQAEQAPGALDRGLHRSRASAADHDELLSRRQLELWDLLRSLAPGDQRIEVPSHLAQPTETVRALVRDEEKRALAEQERESVRGALADACGHVSALESELATVRGEFDQLANRYNTLVNSRRWRVTAAPSRVIGAFRRLGSH